MTEWRVLKSAFPLSAPTEVLGTVQANGRRSAEIKAERKWGTRIVVEPIVADVACGD